MLTPILLVNMEAMDASNYCQCLGRLQENSKVLFLCHSGAAGMERKRMSCRLVDTMHDPVLTAALKYTGLLLILMKSRLIILMCEENQLCVCTQCNPEVFEGGLACVLPGEDSAIRQRGI